MRKVMFMAASLLMTTVASTFAQGVVKVAKDSTKTTVTTSTKVEPAKAEVTVAKDSTTKTVTTTTAKLVKAEMKSGDLPQPVKDLGTNFKAQGWETQEVAYALKNEANEIMYYLVTFKNTKTGETKSININAKGGIVNS
jgi:hypothetical protein